MWKEGKVGPLPCIELAIAEGVRGIPRRLYGGRDPWMGWGIGVAMDAVLVPRALKDCGCWNPGKLVEEDTQELRDRLSDVVKADPASKEKECLMFALQHTKQVKIAKREKKSFTARLILMTSCHWKDLSNTSSHIFLYIILICLLLSLSLHLRQILIWRSWLQWLEQENQFCTLDIFGIKHWRTLWCYH